MSIHAIATMLTFVCFGIAFICWSWLSIEENRRLRRQEQLSEPNRLLKAWALIRGRK
jgi:hypothetical protein